MSVNVSIPKIPMLTSNVMVLGAGILVGRDEVMRLHSHE